MHNLSSLYYKGIFITNKKMFKNQYFECDWRECIASY